MLFQIKYTRRNRAQRDKVIQGCGEAHEQFDTNGPIFKGYQQLQESKHPLVTQNKLGSLDGQVREAYELFYNERVEPNNPLCRFVLEVNKIG